MSHTKSVVLLAAVLFCSLTSIAAEEEEEPKLTIEPRPDQAIKVNDDALFTCSIEGKGVRWIYEKGSNVSTDDKSDRIYQQGGELHIKTVTLNDTGKFICLTNDSALNITAELKVYVMPSYFTEGMIIVGINCGLILLFIGCGVHSLMQNKKDKKRRKEETYRHSGAKHQAVLQME